MSKVWADGTVFAAAMTPVVVAIVKELLERPMQSEVVKRSASRVTEVAAVRRAERPRGPATETAPTPGTNGSSNGAGDVVFSPRRTYGSSAGRRRLSPRAIRIAIVTGLLAFVIAAVALTVPELLFGGSVGSGERSTTIFGGGDSSSERGGDSQDGTRQPSGEEPAGDDGEAAPAPAPAPEDEAPPETQEPAPEEPPADEPVPAPAPAPAPSVP